MSEFPTDLPEYLILSDKVYNLSISLAENSERAFHRGLIDFRVEGINPLIPSDKWRTLLGMTEEVFYDYRSATTSTPLEWTLFRFLCHYVRTNSVHLLSGKGGKVLTTTSIDEFAGVVNDENKAEEITGVICKSWIRTCPEENLKLRDIYVSTDIPIELLKRCINKFKFQNYIEEPNENIYKVTPHVFNQPVPTTSQISLDRKSNRYYQEIQIQASEPFCFVIMPFREAEFSQHIYTEIIKPLIEEEFEILCYRVDEDVLPDRIDNKIYSYILRAAFIIAEISTCNPNVFYELGLAHMLEKDCIILTKSPSSEVPFDVNRISAEPYDDDDSLRAYLRKSISSLAFKIT